MKTSMSLIGFVLCFTLSMPLWAQARRPIGPGFGGTAVGPGFGGTARGPGFNGTATGPGFSPNPNRIGFGAPARGPGFSPGNTNVGFDNVPNDFGRDDFYQELSRPGVDRGF